MRLRTSATDPLRVDWVEWTRPGRLGLTFAPGKHDHSLTSGVRWERDLRADLAAIAGQGGTSLVCLLEPHELALLRIDAYVAEVELAGLRLLRLPIPDGRVPDPAGALGLVAELRARLARDEGVVVHCRGGLGRTGTIAGCVLVDAGLAPQEALARLVAARGPSCPENEWQRAFVRAWPETRERHRTGVEARQRSR